MRGMEGDGGMNGERRRTVGEIKEVRRQAGQARQGNQLSQ